MNADQSDDGQEAELVRLRRRFPRWRIWRGRTTGDYWAMPPRDHPAFQELIMTYPQILIYVNDVAEARRADVERHITVA